MSTADSTPAIPVPWDKLLLWVQQKIAHEMQTGQPVALSRSQLQAVSQFVSFNDEPDVSDHDYVSQLMRMSLLSKANSPPNMSLTDFENRASTISPFEQSHLCGPRTRQYSRRRTLPASLADGLHC